MQAGRRAGLATGGAGDQSSPRSRRAKSERGLCCHRVESPSSPPPRAQALAPQRKRNAQMRAALLSLNQPAGPQVGSKPGTIGRARLEAISGSCPPRRCTHCPCLGALADQRSARPPHMRSQPFWLPTRLRQRRRPVVCWRRGGGRRGDKPLRRVLGRGGQGRQPVVRLVARLRRGTTARGEIYPCDGLCPALCVQDLPRSSRRMASRGFAKGGCQKGAFGTTPSVGNLIEDPETTPDSQTPRFKECKLANLRPNGAPSSAFKCRDLVGVGRKQDD